MAVNYRVVRTDHQNLQTSGIPAFVANAPLLSGGPPCELYWRSIFMLGPNFMDRKLRLEF